MGLLLLPVGALDGWRHCPRCATELQRDEGKVECPACGFVEYANSKPTSSAAIFDDEGRVMLSRRGIEPAAGKWDFPGGFVEEGEHPLDCLHRELDEEAGVSLRDTEFLGVFMDWYETAGRNVATLNLYWTARIGEGTPEPADDVEEFRFFALDEIPEGELAFANLADVVSVLRRRQQHS
jgi:ADP-ribose pyrophosphatase YjhB (NUDIX family)